MGEGLVGGRYGRRRGPGYVPFVLFHIFTPSSCVCLLTFIWNAEQGAWTAQYPPFLITAAEQEEMDETIRRGQRLPPGTQRLIPFVLPRPPVLPRHLDKVILNQRVVSSSPTPPTGASRSRGFVSPMTSTTPSGGGGPAPGSGGGGGGGLYSGTTTVVDLDAPRRRERSSSSRRAAVGPDGVTSPIGDDNSVLPMPSHSVVNHLATSAIRNGVLAVGTTTRYKAKVRLPPLLLLLLFCLLGAVADARVGVYSTSRRFVIDQPGRVRPHRNRRASTQRGPMQQGTYCRTRLIKCPSLRDGRQSFFFQCLPSPPTLHHPSSFHDT
jgi:hypothetical protein